MRGGVPSDPKCIRFRFARPGVRCAVASLRTLSALDFGLLDQDWTEATNTATVARAAADAAADADAAAAVEAVAVAHHAVLAKNP
jgi:hypothetical protein